MPLGFLNKMATLNLLNMRYSREIKLKFSCGVPSNKAPLP